MTRKIGWELEMVGKELYRRIFKLGVDQSIDLIDAYNAAHMEKRLLPQTYGYDPDFDRIPGISRAEP